MTVVKTKAWKIVAVITLIMFALLVLCIAAQNVNAIPRSLGILVFNYGFYIGFGFIWSSLVLFVLSILFWRELSRVQRAVGLGVFLLIIIFFSFAKVVP